jgi:hypothetical protein
LSTRSKSTQRTTQNYIRILPPEPAWQALLVGSQRVYGARVGPAVPRERHRKMCGHAKRRFTGRRTRGNRAVDWPGHRPGCRAYRQEIARGMATSRRVSLALTPTAPRSDATTAPNVGKRSVGIVPVRDEATRGIQIPMTRARVLAVFATASGMLGIGVMPAQAQMWRTCFYHRHSGRGLWATRNVPCSTARRIRRHAMRVCSAQCDDVFQVAQFRCKLTFNGSGGEGNCTASHHREISFGIRVHH